MKKSLLALAVLGAFAGAASAQTSVTIYGSFDGGIRDFTNVDAAGHSKLTMGSNGTYNSNRLGFKGVEDLGGGLNAHFTLESGFNNGTGTLDTPAGTIGTLFNRSAFVGLGGAWGSVDLGRQYSVNFKTIGAYDPFNYKYTAIIPLAAQGGLTRLNNDVQYTGTFGGVTARAEYALGEQAGSPANGSAKAVGVSYAGGPFSVGGAYTTHSNSLPVVGFEDQKNWTVGGAYNGGKFRVAVGYANSKQQTGTVAGDTTAKDAWLGGNFVVSPAVDLTAAYYRTNASAAGIDGRRNLTIVGATYALSKRTNFYADIDHSKLSGSAVPATTQDTNNGVSVGINHLF